MAANSIQVTVNLMSAAAFGAADILFYVNLVLAFFGLVMSATLVALYKKTACFRWVSLAAMIVFAVGAALYFIQLGLYAKNINGTEYAVYACTALLGVGYVTAGAYFACLSRNSDRQLCLATGAMCLVPPIGAVMSIVLSRRIKRDTPIKKRVYSGYAYTYAALGSFAENNSAEFIDGSGEESFRELSNSRKIKRQLKEMKLAVKKYKTPEAKFRYASALVYYTPYKFKKAFGIMNKAAAEGYAPALFNMGYFYETGKHIKRDYKKARDFYRRAAESGDGDASVRLAITDIKRGNAVTGLDALGDMANTGDMYAKYNLGVCFELGLGTDKDGIRAFEIYTECANAGMLAAQKRIFAAASVDISSTRNGDYFRTITDKTFTEKGFSAMIDGLIEIKKRHAADASEIFLKAVKLGGRWEGVARCLVGTLYIDCGKLPEDRHNGAEYIKSAFGLWRGAKDIYAALPKKIR